MTAYAVSEVVHLKLTDIDSTHAALGGPEATGGRILLAQ